MASRGTVYDMDIDPSRKLAVTVSQVCLEISYLSIDCQPSLSLLLIIGYSIQDKKINFLSLETGKSMKSIKPDGESGEPIKVRALWYRCLIY